MTFDQLTDKVCAAPNTINRDDSTRVFISKIVSVTLRELGIDIDEATGTIAIDIAPKPTWQEPGHGRMYTRTRRRK